MNIIPKTTVGLPHSQLAELWPLELKDAKISAVLHPASVLPDLTHVSDLLARPEMPWRLVSLFGPQHGILGHTQDNMIEWEGDDIDPRLGVPVHSLYGKTRKPTAAQLEGVDALLVDLQDVGARYYTFVWTMLLCMEAAWEQGIAVVVLDRPNPLGGDAVEGPILNRVFASFVGLHDVPVRHGLTIGELARMLAHERFPGIALHVLPMTGWTRDMDFDATGLPWVLPSPNMPTVETAFVYPGMCLLEAATPSEGRGTTRPFELCGAPWLDAWKLCEDLRSLDLPGVFFREAFFQPTFHKGIGKICAGVQQHVTDRIAYRPFLTGVAILWAMRKQAYLTDPVEINPLDPKDLPESFGWKAPPYEYETVKLPVDILLGSSWIREGLESGATPHELQARWLPEQAAWRERRRPFLLYPEVA
jgi:uncharacterized protein YbbC (DUF1343 family)